MSGIDEQRERQRAEHLAALARAEAAKTLLEDPLVTTYLAEIETNAIDAMLECKATEDLERLRLSVVALAIRRFRVSLNEAQSGAEFAAAQLQRMDREDGVR